MTKKFGVIFIVKKIISKNIISKRARAAAVVAAFLMAILLLTMTVTSGCGEQAGSAPSIAAATETSGTELDKDILNIGIDSTYPPYCFIKDGKPAGFDIDIIQEIARRLEKDINYVQVPFESMFTRIADEDIDMIISAVPNAQEKSNLVDYSEPYVTVEYMMIALSDSDIRMREDFNGKNMGILRNDLGNFSESFLNTYNLNDYDSVISMLEDLNSTNISGAVLPISIGINVLRENSDRYNLVDKQKSQLAYVIVFEKGSAWKEKIDELLEDMVEEGVYLEIYNKWFRL